MEKGFCDTETRKEKRLLYASIGLLLFVIPMTIAVIVIATKSNKNNICETKTCLEAATKIVQHMNTTVDPCENFYTYACGNYEPTLIYPDYKPRSVNDEMEMEAAVKLMELLEEPPQNDEPKIFTSVRNYFSSCTNTTQINALGLEPLKSLLHQLGGYPMLDGNSWNANVFSWTDTLIKFRKFGLPHYGIFSITVVQDPEKPTKRIIRIALSTVISPVKRDDDSIFNDPIAKAIYNLGVNISVMLGADTSKAKHDIRQVLELLMKIASAKNSPNTEEKKMTVNNLQNLFPHIIWRDFLNSLEFPKILSKDLEILVENPNYISNVSSIISRTDNKIIANSLISIAIAEVIMVLDQEVDDSLMNAAEELGIAGQPYVQLLSQRRIRCITFTVRFFSVALAAMYVRSDRFDKDSKPMVEGIYDNVLREVSEGIKKIKWLQGKDIETAENKIKLLRREIGYSDALLRDNEIEDYYANIIISEDQFFYNYLNVVKNWVDHKYNLLAKRTNEEQLSEVFVISNIDFDYTYETTTIEIFATSLEKPYFDVNWPNYLNYGAIGTRIGRSFVTAIDPGDRVSSSREHWNENTIDKYTEVQDCIEKQHEDFRTRIDAEENSIIGRPKDILSVAYAYDAYVKWEKKNMPEMLLPSLQLTNRQLFWISVANTWCEVGNEMMMPSVHSPLPVALINSPDFARDFNCPTGSIMNPKKCYTK